MTQRRQFFVGVSFLGLGFVALPLSLWTTEVSWWVHGGWCIMAMVLVAIALHGAFVRGFESILRNHFVMLTLAFAVYFVIGALLPVIGPKATVEYALSYFPISGKDALRVDAANSIGFGIALTVGSLSSGRLLSQATRQLSRLTGRVSPIVAVSVFWLVGIPAIFFVYASDLGLRAGLVSGIWRTLAMFTFVGIFLASAYNGIRQGLLLLLAVSVAILSSAAGLALFNKTAVLIPLGALIAGLSIRYRSQAILLAGIAVLIGIFAALGGLVSFGRSSLPSELAAKDAIELRLTAMNKGVKLTARGDVQTAYHPWARLSYLSPQAAGMDLYDRGAGGDQLRLIPWLLVPRTLVPEKPIITDASRTFHTKVTGRTGSSTGQGIFVTAYYNGGWLALVVIAAVCGWILSQTSAVSETVFEKRDALLMPLALSGVYMAFRIDGDFLADYFGAFVFLLYALIAGGLISTLVIKRRLRLE